jgi:hypothetical protein
MILWIVLGYLATSIIASLVFYAACVAAARADHVREQQQLGKGAYWATEAEPKRSEAVGAPSLALRA